VKSANIRSVDGDLIYLDFNATTPVDPAVLAAMLSYFTDQPGNAASAHAFGRRAAAGVAEARGQLADAIGAGPGSIVFTSGATESDNLALRGAWAGRGPEARSRVITVATEHKAILETAIQLADAGADLVILATDRNGRFDLEELREALRVPTVLVSVMAANNETGLLSPLREVADLVHEAGALVHTDAAQVLGKTSFDVRETGVDLASLSAHKAYGPKGVGALFVAPGTELIAQLRGGGQEQDLRSGTLNVPGIVGFGAAAALAAERRDEDIAREAALRDQLWKELSNAIPGIIRNGPASGVLPNTLNVRLPDGDAEDLLLASPRLGAATGSACTAGSPEPSHVLLAMDLSYEQARASIRFSLGRTTTEADIKGAVAELVAGIGRLS
jgi:cysteine desulfurase